MPENRIGQRIEVGDVITHTTASQHASLSLGFVRGFTETKWRGTQVKVTWVWSGGYSRKGRIVKTMVGLRTVTKIDPSTIDPELQVLLNDEMMEEGL
ncbi:hypothetical protein Wildcat_89 [Mycobacterium phage Wildcat]|uniref:Uncharacterized protein n=2 Tax=Mycobacterium virus Wildcat TaxID=1993859 RepID=Q19XX1_9CAUD|nr:hypothetical protein Wildcat_89 [Mycobacterium phage Wildcat]ABE67694.1 hypothetical protein Wildcat_89 [Mycobacterium phage Wildcat]QGJ89976.1 hypothetical protein PBI_MARYV_89 [Mycobacterium phage MaryV]